MKLKAVKNVFPDRGCIVSHSGREDESICWPPSEAGGEPIPLTADELAKVEVEYKKLKKEQEDSEYRRNRAREYPAPGEQFNKIYDDGVEKWKTEMIDPIKKKWPKDNSGPVE